MRIIELSGPRDEALVCEAWRLRLARGLMRASAGLTRLACALTRLRSKRAQVPELEFYAEAGAPEGALYVDGQLVGQLHGVTRL
ncbi:MAG TPA: hypothetical protein VGM81_06995 [Burkholderiaceae bacterium]|jgi:hypothetical protein